MLQHLFKSRWIVCYHFQEQTNGNSPIPEWNVASLISTITFANLQTLSKIYSKQVSNTIYEESVLQKHIGTWGKSSLSSTVFSFTRVTLNQEVMSKALIRTPPWIQKIPAVPLFPITSLFFSLTADALFSMVF